MRPNLKDVMAVLESVSEGGSFDIVINQNGWSTDSESGPYVMGRDRRKSVRKAIDDAEKKFHLRRCETETKHRGVDEYDEEG